MFLADDRLSFYFKAKFQFYYMKDNLVYLNLFKFNIFEKIVLSTT